MLKEGQQNAPLFKNMRNSIKNISLISAGAVGLGFGVAAVPNTKFKFLSRKMHFGAQKTSSKQTFTYFSSNFDFEIF